MDLLSFNICSADNLFLCPVCGWKAFEAAPFDTLGGIIGTGICSCCLYEPGFDDDEGASRDAEPTVIESVRKYRDRWKSAGMPWRGTHPPPPAEWDPHGQLSRLLGEHRQLR